MGPLAEVGEVFAFLGDFLTAFLAFVFFVGKLLVVGGGYSYRNRTGIRQTQIGVLSSKGDGWSSSLVRDGFILPLPQR